MGGGPRAKDSAKSSRSGRGEPGRVSKRNLSKPQEVSVPALPAIMGVYHFIVYYLCLKVVDEGTKGIFYPLITDKELKKQYKDLTKLIKPSKLVLIDKDKEGSLYNIFKRYSDTFKELDDKLNPKQRLNELAKGLGFDDLMMDIDEESSLMRWLSRGD